MSDVDPEVAAAMIQADVPPNWYAGPIQMNRWFDPIEGTPPITFEVEFRWGQPIEGGPFRHYIGGGGIQPSGRSLTVKATGHTIEDLASVARLLPSLEALGKLPWPIEFDINGWTV